MFYETAGATRASCRTIPSRPSSHRARSDGFRRAARKASSISRLSVSSQRLRRRRRSSASPARTQIGGFRARQRRIRRQSREPGFAASDEPRVRRRCRAQSEFDHTRPDNGAVPPWWAPARRRKPCRDGMQSDRDRHAEDVGEPLDMYLVLGEVLPFISTSASFAMVYSIGRPPTLGVLRLSGLRGSSGSVHHGRAAVLRPVLGSHATINIYGATALFEDQYFRARPKPSGCRFGRMGDVT